MSKIMNSSLLALLLLVSTGTQLWAKSSEKKSDEKGKEVALVFPADSGPQVLDIKNLPKDIQSAYKISAWKCSKCHTFARVLNTMMYDADSDWKRYVKRMMRKPGSEIDKKKGKKIYRFLKYDQLNRKEIRAENFFLPLTIDRPDTPPVWLKKLEKKQQNKKQTKKQK